MAADGLKPQEALVVHKGHHKADDIHVGGEHHTLAGALFVAVYVAQSVGKDLVHIGLGQLGQQSALGLFKAGRKGHFHQLLLQFQNIQHVPALLTD